ncbi:patatin-like phospholipase family protein [Pontibacter sp. E15-1]|uniref:patatin-like phospholipase family protein n=1 Tax=Pontibacter sp. E15-1 TaxID=2919918 RepID=UPI001F4F98DF|nr:patatin-like phospholipase family protein [Pontibacter sp. E15-1]MCJ8167163.1 patatin-like phospholipase family protein [Pontibacter sp. E15-1]
MSKQTFHLGLCLAGSVSAGAYTAGVMDYLLEALENWEKARGTDPSVPDHNVEIDLFGGASGGGITAAMAYFAFRDKIEHPVLEDDGRTLQVSPEKNILWKLWVELTGGDVFDQMLDTEDIDNYFIPSAMNARFIDKVGQKFEDYVREVSASGRIGKPAFVSEDAELFMTLFNVTGMKYQLNSKALGAAEQYISEHRDLAHFRWSDRYEKDGRMEISAGNLDNLKPLIEASKATGAFPIGLRARPLSRKAKYIWDNPFFRKNGKFGKGTIGLGKTITEEEDLYKSLIADGGTSNNEPVELMRDLLLQVRLREEDRTEELASVNAMNDTERMEAKSIGLENSSVILIDPFPSYDFDIEEPAPRSEHVFSYATDLAFAMASQLRFDAKEAIEAYDKDSYGLHVIAPSRDDVDRPEYAIACGALAGFGGFLSKEYRIHDYFLGRHNCQSFLRKYFVVDPEERKVNEDGSPNEQYACVSAVIDGYRDRAALERFCFEDEKGRKWVPIIPDVTLQKPIVVRERKIREGVKQITYEETGKLPLYKMDLPQEDFLDRYYDLIIKRINKLMNNTHDSNWFVDMIVEFVAARLDDRAADEVMEIIRKDLNRRKLVRS